MAFPTFRFIVGVSTATLAAAANPATQASAKPNILFILVDDMGPRDAGYLGSNFYETPALDRLARDGMRFEQAYVAYPRCTPSRYALMSGKNPARQDGRRGEQLPASETTFAEALKAGGYHTFFAGKWHLGKTPNAMPQAQGFDINIGGGSAGAVASHFFPYGAEKGRQLGAGLETGEKGEYIADRLADETIKFLEQHARSKSGQPFAAVLSHYAVHTPLEAKADLLAKYQAKLKSLGGAKADGILKRDGDTKKYQDVPVYAAMVESVDQGVARIRAALERLNMDRNTVIILTSDHGGLSNRGAGRTRQLATSNLPYRAGKGHLYDGGLRVPMIVYWPGSTKAGSVSQALIQNTDHYPTMLELAGLPLRPQQHMDGQSYLAQLKGSAAPSRTLHWYNSRPRPDQTGDTSSAAMRTANWKFFLSFDPTVPDGLFDLSADPGEERNLAKANPTLAAKMKSDLEAWLKEVKASPPSLGRGQKAKNDDDEDSASGLREERREKRRAKRKAGA